MLPKLMKQIERKYFYFVEDIILILAQRSGFAKEW